MKSNATHKKFNVDFTELGTLEELEKYFEKHDDWWIAVFSGMSELMVRRQKSHCKKIVVQSDSDRDIRLLAIVHDPLDLIAGTSITTNGTNLLTIIGELVDYPSNYTERYKWLAELRAWNLANIKLKGINKHKQ